MARPPRPRRYRSHRTTWIRARAPMSYRADGHPIEGDGTMRILRGAVLVAATFLSSLGSAYACQGTTFLTPEQEQYNLRTDYTKTGPGQFNVTPAMNSWAPQALMVSDERTINLCATVTMLSTADQNDSGVGLLFWYNGQNFE